MRLSSSSEAEYTFFFLTLKYTDRKVCGGKRVIEVIQEVSRAACATLNFCPSFASEFIIYP